MGAIIAGASCCQESVCWRWAAAGGGQCQEGKDVIVYPLQASSCAAFCGSSLVDWPVIVNLNRPLTKWVGS